MLPSVAKGIAEKKFGGKGTPVQAKRPRKCCKICVKFFDHVVSKEQLPLEPGICLECDTMLKEGYIAFTSGDRFCFAKSEALNDMAGTIVQISESVFQQLAAKHSAKIQEKEKHGEHPQSGSAGDV